MGWEQNVRKGGEGVGRKEKACSWAHTFYRTPFVHEREAIRHNNWSIVCQSKHECQQLVNRWIMDRSISELRSSTGSSLAVIEDNSFKFALRETAEVFSQSGKSINLKSEPVAAIKSLLSWKDVLVVLPTGFGKSAIFQFFLRVKEYMLKDSACIWVICPLRNFWQGLTANSLPEASLEDLRVGKFQLLFSSAENVLGN